jgi:hypothetical protein
MTTTHFGGGSLAGSIGWQDATVEILRRILIGCAQDDNALLVGTYSALVFEFRVTTHLGGGSLAG